MFDMSKREIRSEALQYVGDAKIGKLTGNGGTYPQLRLPRTYAHLIGKKAHLFEITQDGQTAFLISTSDSLSPSTEGLNQSEQVLQPFFALEAIHKARPRRLLCDIPLCRE